MHDTFLRPLSDCTSQEFDGRCRVVIENVSPEIDGGCFPAKGVEGQGVRVAADVFVDGADMLRAELLVRLQGEKEWEVFAMEDGGNDRWQAAFTAGRPGMHEYTICAWVDHFSTWRRGLGKKVDAKQDVTLDLEIGALLVDAAVARASSADSKKLKLFASAMRAKGRGKGLLLLSTAIFFSLWKSTPTAPSAPFTRKIFCSGWTVKRPVSVHGMNFSPAHGAPSPESTAHSATAWRRCLLLPAWGLMSFTFLPSTR